MFFFYTLLSTKMFDFLCEAVCCTCLLLMLSFRIFWLLSNITKAFFCTFVVVCKAVHDHWHSSNNDIDAKYYVFISFLFCLENVEPLLCSLYKNTFYLGFFVMLKKCTQKYTLVYFLMCCHWFSTLVNVLTAQIV